MNPIASGFAGAAALTAIHETTRRLVNDAPRMDVVGGRALTRMSHVAGLEPPRENALYALTMVGDLISNAIYYSAVGSGNRGATWARAVALGLAAGIGAIVLPERLGLGTPPHNEQRRTRLLTVGYYLAGALVAAAVATAGMHERRPDVAPGNAATAAGRA